MLKVGDKAPLNVKIHDMDEKEITLVNYAGNYTVVYFYPADDTPGCTVEACEFRDFNEDIKKLGAEIVGISKDKVKSHHKFKKKFDLNFTLLSDPESELQKAFGVWQEKSMFGKKFLGTLRTTFILDPKGKIVKVWEKVTPEGHAKEVFESLKSLVTS